MKYKILFPAGYNIDNTQNDNLDINIVLENNDVYFATLFTLKNISYLMEKDSVDYFFADSMVVVSSLDMNTIERIIKEVVENQYLESTFSRIGTIKEIFDTDRSFDDLYNNLKVI
ncbi:hypothetical protein FJ651_15585 [Paucihalobacter ruber]|uniref:Uncharacterized protein n=1 Tax=Paucihalobacter ruber TaxID=2567861 RepID=A0A506PC05_9FLAO|nr:hypothetical protein [Paucihalobacter ruber]TPV31119.1 hypothetical protein FJ651_15585 [Paucihalobacter ruber]